MPKPMESIYITSDTEFPGSVVLQCREHSKWYAEVQNVELPEAVGFAEEHVRDDHRTHVLMCMCRDRVFDGRCVPDTSL